MSRKEAESSSQHSPSESPGSCEFQSVPKTSSDAQVCLTRGCDSESSHDFDQPCTKVESTSLKKFPSETFDTITNSATTPNLTQVDANSGHESVPPTLASSDDGISASQGLPISKIDCPISSRTRSEVKQHQSDQDLGIDSTTVLPTNPKSSVSNARLQPPTRYAEVKRPFQIYTCLLHALRMSKLKSDLLQASYAFYVSENGLCEVIQPSYTLSGSQNDLSKSIHASYTLYRSQNELFDLLQASYTLYGRQKGLNVLIQASYTHC